MQTFVLLFFSLVFGLIVDFELKNLVNKNKQENLSFLIQRFENEINDNFIKKLDQKIKALGLHQKETAHNLIENSKTSFNYQTYTLNVPYSIMSNDSIKNTKMFQIKLSEITPKINAEMDFKLKYSLINNPYFVKQDNHRVFFLSSLNIWFEASLNPELLSGGLNETRKTLSYYVIASILIILIFSNYFTKKIFLQPLKDLKDNINDFSKGELPLDFIAKPMIEEWSELSNQFMELSINSINNKTELLRSKEELSMALIKLKEQQIYIIHNEKLASIGTLAAGVAHEINNPTTYIYNNIYSLRRYFKDLSSIIDKFSTQIEANDLKNYEEINEDLPQLFNECEDGLNKITKIVKSLKNFTHDDPDEPIKASLNTLINNAIKVTNSAIKNKAELKVELKDLPDITIFPAQITQILVNILINATQAIKNYGTIIVSSEQLNDNIRISITDDGEGMDEFTKLNLFDPFFTTKAVDEGTGLGLAISLDIAKNHKGYIELKSKLNVGSTFTLILPVK